jgi:hypothetical protein
VLAEYLLGHADGEAVCASIGNKAVIQTGQQLWLLFGAAGPRWIVPTMGDLACGMRNPHSALLHDGLRRGQKSALGVNF